MTAHPVVLVGHPFAPIGMGEHLRATFRALRAAGTAVRLLDVYGMSDPEPDLDPELKPYIVDRVGPGPALFCINGDEVAPILGHLGTRAEGASRRIVYPAWELPNYPAEWARELERFDEVWSASAYSYASISVAVRPPVHHLPLATEVRSLRPRGRRSFGIPEDAYVFLFFFDLTSFIERKNPFAALEAFRRVRARRPGRDVRFVAKLNSSRAKPDDRKHFLDFLAPFGDSVVLMDGTLLDAEVKALLMCADAFVSLHRAEGYGFGIAEAMFLGKPVVATGYSGNMDFMAPGNSFPVGYRLVPVPDGAYPFPGGQLWAEPEVEEAAEAMWRLAQDPGLGRRVGAEASRHIRTHFSYRAIGLRMAARLAAG